MNANLLQNAIKGMTWTAGSGILRLVVGSCTFFLVVSHLTPAQLGAYGVATLIFGLSELFTASPFGESLQQRSRLRRSHLNATFWFILILTICASAILAVFADDITHSLNSPGAAMLLYVLLPFLPLSALSVVNTSILRRQLKFDKIAKIQVTSSLISGFSMITCFLVGAGLWSLLYADLIGRIYTALSFWRETRYKPGSFKDLRYGRDLARFNTETWFIYLIGHADGIAPRFLTTVLLGPVALGHLMVAERVMNLAKTVLLSPIASVTMTTIARVQNKLADLKKLVIAFYRLTALVGYPGFLCAIIVFPDLASLFGEQWITAILVSQILLLRGIRLTTGILNIAILRGVGDQRGPIILLVSGFVLHATLIPIGANWGIEGVAVAMLLRTLLTWPLGMIFIKQATHLSVWRQMNIGMKCLLYAFIATLCVVVAQLIISDQSSALRVVWTLSVFSSVYLALLALSVRRSLGGLIQKLRAGEFKDAFRTLQYDLAR